MAGESNFRQALKELAEKVNLTAPVDSKPPKADERKTDFGVVKEFQPPKVELPTKEDSDSEGFAPLNVQADKTESAKPEPIIPENNAADSSVKLSDPAEGLDSETGRSDDLFRFGNEFSPKPKSNEVTRISKGTSIVGEIRSDGDIEFFGDLKGNIETSGNLRISGKIAGDVKGSDIEITASGVQGNIVSSATVKIDEQTKIVGNVKAGSLLFDGKLKGDIDVQSSICFMKNALLVGNVTADVISVESGAKIQGQMRISKNMKDNFFEEKA